MASSSRLCRKLRNHGANRGLQNGIAWAQTARRQYRCKPLSLRLLEAGRGPAEPVMTRRARVQDRVAHLWLESRQRYRLWHDGDHRNDGGAAGGDGLAERTMRGIVFIRMVIAIAGLRRCTAPFRLMRAVEAQCLRIARCNVDVGLCDVALQTECEGYQKYERGSPTAKALRCLIRRHARPSDHRTATFCKASCYTITSVGAGV